MGTSHRTCETCVYCSFAGNCDRYDRPLTSIEQPACDDYDIHPLLAENAKLREQLDVAEHNRTRNAREYARMCHENDKLRELLREMWTFTELVDVCGRLSSGGAWNAAGFEKRMRELGVVK